MQGQSFWPGWAQFLQRWGLRDAAAAVLVSGGPLALLMAQLVYLNRPIFASPQGADQWQALAGMLENPQDSASFAAFLQEEN
jgi:hypothetical protein